MNPTSARKLALITGGTKGIGFAVAEVLAREGYDLALTYAADTVGAERARQDLQDSFPARSISVVRADVTELDSIGIIDAHVESLGLPIDALVLNAGLTDRSSFEELDPVAWQRVLNANLTFPTFLLQRLLPRIRKGGAVCFTGSLMGILPHSMSLSYGVTKAATHALVQNLVKFLSPYGVRVNAVAPGFVDTDWQKTKPVEIRNSINSKISLDRFAETQEIAEVFLMTIENTYMNGEVIRIDGGYSYK